MKMANEMKSEKGGKGGRRIGQKLSPHRMAIITIVIIVFYRLEGVLKRLDKNTSIQDSLKTLQVSM